MDLELCNQSVPCASTLLVYFPFFIEPITSRLAVQYFAAACRLGGGNQAVGKGTRDEREEGVDGRRKIKRKATHWGRTRGVCCCWSIHLRRLIMHTRALEHTHTLQQNRQQQQQSKLTLELIKGGNGWMDERTTDRPTEKDRPPSNANSVVALLFNQRWDVTRFFAEGVETIRCLHSRSCQQKFSLT